MAKQSALIWFSLLFLYLSAACSSGQPTADKGSQEDVPVETTATPTQDVDTANAQPAEAAASVAATATVETTIIPGERVGPVTPDTSRADLVNWFGEAALQDTDIPVGEGFTEAGTTVNAGSDQAFSIIWADERQSQPATVKDLGPAWQTPEGLHIGTTFDQLQTVLGEFDLYGFAWDYGGTVVLKGSNLAAYDGQLILRLQPTLAAVTGSPEAFQAVTGDRLISSNNPNLSALELVVDDMIVYLTPPDQ